MGDVPAERGFARVCGEECVEVCGAGEEGEEGKEGGEIGGYEGEG